MAERANQSSVVVILCILLAVSYWLMRLWRVRVLPLFIEEGACL